jgi:hypothetical protein
MPEPVERFGFEGNRGWFRSNSLEVDPQGVHVTIGSRTRDVPFAEIEGLMFHSMKRIRVVLPIFFMSTTTVEVRIQCPGYTRARPLVVSHRKSFASPSDPQFQRIGQVFGLIARSSFTARMDRYFARLEESGEFTYAGRTFTLDGQITSHGRTASLLGSRLELFNNGRLLRITPQVPSRGMKRIDVPLSWDLDVILHVIKRIMEVGSAAPPPSTP